MTVAFYKEIIDYIEAQSGGLLITGQNLFAYPIPLEADEIETASCVIPRGGIPELNITDGTVGRMDLQIYIRGKDFMAAMTLANLISGILTDKAGVGIITERFIHVINAKQSPTFMGMDIRDRHEFIQNFEVLYSDY